MNIFNVDCLTFMRLMPDQCIDVILTDPPYGINFSSGRRAKRFSCLANDDSPFIWWLYDAYRVMKEGGVLYCFSAWKTQEVFRLAIEWAGFKILSHVVWDREVHGMGDLKHTFAPRHDIIWFATKGKNNAFVDIRPKSVVRASRKIAKLIHPTEKPVSLLVELLKPVLKEGIVFDPMMGTGATGVACKQLGLDFLGIEIDPNHFEIAKNRL